MTKDKKKSVGLLGGSFNPAHNGHLHISLKALEILNVDEVWWLVSPQNPLKSSKEMASYEERVKSASQITKKHSNKIKISEFEEKKGLCRTYETITTLQSDYPDINFIWLMGADNLVIFHKWYKWEDIFKKIPIVIFDRDKDKEKALTGEAALLFKNSMLKKELASQIKDAPCPVWCFIDIEKHSASSTKIRNKSDN